MCATLKDGTLVTLHSSGHSLPPDHTGMAPQSCSLWALHNGHWYRTRVSKLEVLRDLEQCDTWEEVLLFDVVETPGVPVNDVP